MTAVPPKGQKYVIGSSTPVASFAVPMTLVTLIVLSSVLVGWLIHTPSERAEDGSQSTQAPIMVFLATDVPSPTEEPTISPIPTVKEVASYYAAYVPNTPTNKYDSCDVAGALTPCVPIRPLTPTPVPTPKPIEICQEEDYSYFASSSDVCLKPPYIETNPWGEAP